MVTQTRELLPRRRFDVDDYYAMADAGILDADDRVELIDGQVVEMSPIGRRHGGCVNRLNHLFMVRSGQRCVVQVQGPLRLNRLTEVEPDLALLRPRDDFYSGRHPVPGDVLLVVEVADSSLAQDLEVKVPLYASAGIPVVWVIDVVAGVVRTFREPVEGAYRDAREFRRGDDVPAPDPRGGRIPTVEILGPG